MQNVSKSVSPISSGSEAQKPVANQKEYSAPKLTEYGDIASLVKGLIVAGIDGPPNPPFDAFS